MGFRLLAYILFFLAIAWLTVIFVEQIIDPLDPPLLQIELPDSPSFTADGADIWSIFLPILLKGRVLNPVEVELIASEPTSEGGFGGSVSLSGDVALVGTSKFAYPSPDNPSTAYFYRWDGRRWVEEGKQGAEHQGFGYATALSVSGDVALISAPYQNNPFGEVYLYRFNGSSWQHAPHDTLRASDGEWYDQFGSSVSIYHNLALIGNPYDDDQGSASGSAYVYRWDGTQWQEESKLVASDGESSDKFGSSVSIYDNLALIGAPYDDDQAADSGAAYVYRWDGTQWQEESKLFARDGQEDQRFGSSVSLYDELALVGIKGKLGYLFQSNGSDWQEVQKLVAHYGYSNSAVALRRHMALVGASLYRWDEEGWQESRELIPRDSKNYSLSHLSVSLTDEMALVGVPFDDDHGDNSGLAYVYHLFPGNVPLIAVSPPNIQRAVIEGTASMSEPLSIQNHGSAPLEWNVSSAANWLTMTPTQGTVMPSDTLSVTVTRPPLPANAYTDTLTITSNALNKPDIEVPLYFRVNKQTTKVKLLASDGNVLDHFGSAVSLSHNTPSSNMMALIGAPLDNENGADSGAAYLYRWDGLSWIEEAKLTASDGASGDQFGSSVSLDGEWAVIGAPGAPDNDEQNRSSVYLFRWNGSTWQQKAKLRASDGESPHHFGRAVSLSGNVALVGSHPSSYIYRFNGERWQEEAKLETEFWLDFDSQIKISVSGDVALVGGHQRSCSGGCETKNIVHLYRWNGSRWVQEAQLPTSEQLVWDVSTNGEQALIGMDGEAILYRFQQESWQPQATFQPSDGVVSTFGQSVALSGDKVLIGQYLYGWNGSEWIEEAKLGFDNTLPISLNDHIALVGSPFDDDYGLSSGSAYFYHLAPEDGPKVTLSPPHMQHTLNIGHHTITPLTITNHSTDTLRWQASISDTTWLNITPTFGTLTPNQSHRLSVTLDAAALEMGHYTDTVSLTMGDSPSATLDPSVGLTVLPAESKLSAEQSRFGKAVSLSGEVALVGSPLSDHGCWSGAAHLYRWNGSQWLEEAKLTARSGICYNEFGSSVSLDGEIALIGAFAISSDRAYVYRWNGTSWQEEAKLTPKDGNIRNEFGQALSLNGNLALVGAPGHQDHLSYSGAAYLYRWDGERWQEEAKLLASDGKAYDKFGASLFVHDELAIVGAPGNDELDSGSGAAYVYRWNGTNWIEEAKLTASDGSAYDRFGSSISFNDNRLLIGAPGSFYSGHSSGSVYMYRWDGATWIEEAKLTARDGDLRDNFGASLSLSGDIALVGAPGDDNLHGNSGAAYLYRWDGENWIEQIKLTASDGSSYGYFGAAVSLSGNTALIGTANRRASSIAGAYLYQLPVAEQ